MSSSSEMSDECENQIGTNTASPPATYSIPSESEICQVIMGCSSSSTLSWYDQEILPLVRSTIEKLVETQSALRKCGIELWFDGREKQPLKTALSRWFPNAKQQSAREADFRIRVRGLEFFVIERKTWMDALGSIGKRTELQKLHLTCLPMPHDRKFYLYEEVSQADWIQFRKHNHHMSLNQLMGARANIFVRDGFRMMETKSLLDTVFLLGKLMLKTYEHIKTVDANMQFQRMSANSINNNINDSSNHTQTESESETLKRAMSGHPLWFLQQQQQQQERQLGTLIDFAAHDQHVLETQITANKSQQKTKKRHIECETENHWIHLLCQIPRMTVPKAQAVADVYVSLPNLVHAAESDLALTVKTMADLIPKNEYESKESRRIGPALSNDILTYFGLDRKPNDTTTPFGAKVATIKHQKSSH